MSLKWTGEDIEVITDWLMVRDTNGELCNFLLYLKGNKAEVARQLLYDTGLGQTKLGVTKEKTRDKIGSMIALYKTWRNKAEETGWGLDVTYHDQVMENIRGNTIREVLIQKCPWYYQLEEIMGGSPTVSPPFLMESGHANRETNTPEELYRDHDTQQYQDWIDNGNNQDHKDDFEDEDFWPALQSHQNQDGEKSLVVIL